MSRDHGGPAMRLLSLGAGVQSTTVAILAAQGRIEAIDGAIFADTGWEPRAVYDHLDRLERDVLEPAGIPLHRVRQGNLREDMTTPGRWFASAPLYLRNGDGTDGMSRRSCTADYKVRPIKRQARLLLGARTAEDGRVLSPPAGAWAEQLIGISLDEVHRAKDSDVRYVRHAFPLLVLGWTRNDCLRFLEREDWSSTPKSACIGCPFHGNRAWRTLRNSNPAEWADAVAFDARLRDPDVRKHLGLDGEPYLHRSRVPLSEAPIDRPQRDENQTIDLLEAIRDAEWDEAEEPPGCSPFACRSDGL